MDQASLKEGLSRGISTCLHACNAHTFHAHVCICPLVLKRWTCAIGVFDKPDNMNRGACFQLRDMSDGFVQLTTLAVGDFAQLVWQLITVQALKNLALSAIVYNHTV